MLPIMPLIRAIPVLLAPVLLAFSLSLAGCTAKNPHNYTPQEKIQQPGDLGTVKTVLKGDSILRQQIEIVSDVLVVSENVVCGGGFFVPSTIHSGMYLKTGEDGNNAYFTTVTTDGQRMVAGDHQLDSIRCQMRDGSLSVLSTWGGYLPCARTTSAEVKRNQEIINEIEPSQQKSLVYNGCNGQLVSFTYREGKDRLNITHNMDDGNVFSRNGAKIEILSYSKHSLTCRVLQSFSTSEQRR